MKIYGGINKVKPLKESHKINLCNRIPPHYRTAMVFSKVKRKQKPLTTYQKIIKLLKEIYEKKDKVFFSWPF